MSEYNPDRYGQALDLEMLNINQKVTCLMAAQFDGFLNDLLIIATHDSVIAFDVENNKDIFFKEVILVIFNLIEHISRKTLNYCQYRKLNILNNFFTT